MKSGKAQRASALDTSFVATAICLAGAGLLAGYVVMPSPKVRAAEAAVVRVAGHAVPETGDPHALALALARDYLHTPVTLHVAGETVVKTRAALGATVDADHLAALITDARDRMSAMRRLHTRVSGNSPLLLSMPVSVDAERAMPWLLDIKDHIDRSPQDARVDTQTLAIREEQPGRRVDAYKSLELIHDALSRGVTDVELVVEHRAASRTRASLEGIQLGAVLGEFETHYNAADTAQDRTFNLRIAASKVDGMVVMPGEVFDFNGHVGERSEANGFRVAPVIAEGELVDGVGGGTCQIAGSLHAAVFFAGLPILTREPHSRPSFYIKMGLDAMVSYPNMNLRFQNDMPFPIAIGLRVEHGDVHAEIRGMQRSRTVTFLRRIDRILPFEEREDQDPSLPTGVRVLRQRGVPGFKISRWRVIENVAVHQSFREHMEDTYPATTQIWRVGSGGPAPAGFVAPPGDAHPEYVADEYLITTEGVGIEGLVETRRPGRSGAYGWSSRPGYDAPLSFNR